MPDRAPHEWPEEDSSPSAGDEPPPVGDHRPAERSTDADMRRGDTGDDRWPPKRMSAGYDPKVKRHLGTAEVVCPPAASFGFTVDADPDTMTAELNRLAAWIDHVEQWETAKLNEATPWRNVSVSAFVAAVVATAVSGIAPQVLGLFTAGTAPAGVADGVVKSLLAVAVTAAVVVGIAHVTRSDFTAAGCYSDMGVAYARRKRELEAIKRRRTGPLGDKQGGCGSA